MPELTDNQTTASDSQLYEFLFGVLRSCRYHHRRVQFFDRLNVSASLLATLSGVGTLLSVLAVFGSEWVAALAAMTAVSGAFELTVGTARSARLHTHLANEFIALEQEIRKVQDNIPIQGLRTLQCQRLEIEAKEPPPLKVLDAMCHNELIRALGHDETQLVKISALQRFVAHLFDLNEHSLLAPVWDTDTNAPRPQS